MRTNRFTLKGRIICKGVAEGEAVVSHEPLQFLGAVSRDGRIIERGHELEGQTIAGKILVFPKMKGSTENPYYAYMLKRAGSFSKGIINVRADDVAILCSIMCKVPAMDKLDKNPLEVIQTGDHVKIDADNGIVEVVKTED